MLVWSSARLGRSGVLKPQPQAAALAGSSEWRTSTPIWIESRIGSAAAAHCIPIRWSGLGRSMPWRDARPGPPAAGGPWAGERRLEPHGYGRDTRPQQRFELPWRSARCQGGADLATLPMINDDMVEKVPTWMLALHSGRFAQEEALEQHGQAAKQGAKARAGGQRRGRSSR